MPSHFRLAISRREDRRAPSSAGDAQARAPSVDMRPREAADRTGAASPSPRRALADEQTDKRGPRVWLTLKLKYEICERLKTKTSFKHQTESKQA